MARFDRRSFLVRSGAFAGGALLAPPLLQTMTGVVGATAMAGGYGPLQPVVPANEPGGFAYLALPAGFSYVVFGKTKRRMTDGITPYPQNHDGMAAFALPNGQVRLTRNAEDRNPPGMGSVGGPAGTRYDPRGGGGVTVIDFDIEDRAVVNDFIGINGTIVNCAGGIAYRKVGWLTCEETTAGPEEGWAEKHGYVFLLPADATATVPAEPLRAMGRFSHEAAVAGPFTGTIYMTEDAGSGRGSGLYRFVPDDPDDLTRGGKLFMLGIKDHPRADLREGQRVGRKLPVRWLPVHDPDPDPVVDIDEPGANSCFAQGYAAGGALFNRLEGIWRARYGFVFTSTSGGDAKNGDVNDDGYEEGFGQVWRYIPKSNTVVLEYQSPGGGVLDSPDNLTVSPRGGILLCEDDASSGDGDTHPLAPGITDVNRLVGVGSPGGAFEFAVNRFNDTEFAGACYSPDGSTLFVNIFGNDTVDSGMTCAITGPWERGRL